MATDNSLRILRRRVWGSVAITLAMVLGAVLTVMPNPSTRPGFAAGEEEAADNARRAKERYADSNPYPMPAELIGVELMRQSKEQAASKSTGCIHCHQGVGDPHVNKPNVHLGCTDCHGGDASVIDKLAAHVHPRHPEAWVSSANPVRSYTLLNDESPEFVRFVNPGDLRIAHISCGTAGCHPKEVLQNRKSMMTHGCMLWGAALYNNGAIPFKWPRYGEAYTMNGKPVRLQTVPAPTAEEMARGVLPFLDPLPRFEVSQPGNVLRIFERGGRFRSELGIPESQEESGKPRERLSDRGLGTQNRTDPVFIGLQKTRLLDPTLNFMGTNDHPGDYRSSGCTACHVVYANDRSANHSGPYAAFGNRGMTASDNPDPTIPKNESGHPIQHAFTSGVPSSQCMVCHIHPGTNVMNSYFGYMWWDLETEAQKMYPAEQRYPTSEEFAKAQMKDPNETSARGLWNDDEFLNDVTDLNALMDKTQFGDFHGHGWVFRAVFKKNLQGTLLDYAGNPIPEVNQALLQEAIRDLSEEELKSDRGKKCAEGSPVHLKDIHLEKGMHCVDCHFSQDVHGDAKLYGEVRAAIEIQCVDCHGSFSKKATLRTSGPAAGDPVDPGIPRGRDLTRMKTPSGKPRFERRGDKIIQNSMVYPYVAWEITQTANTLDPEHPDYNEKSHLAKTVQHRSGGDGFEWGAVPSHDQEKPGLIWNGEVQDEKKCVHASEKMSCIACHSSWNPSCFGCHLPQKANRKLPNLHFEGQVTRNYVAYDWQTLRDDVYMLAKDGNATGNRIGPARSSCAIHVGSYNNNRESIYVQQQTISGEGLSGIAFSTNVPHTVRGNGVGETKMCNDCHLAKDNTNNALMAQLLMHGTGYMNFIGRYCWMAAGDGGLYASVVTEQLEPQTVIGSTMHKIVFPDFYRNHLEKGKQLQDFHHHPGKDISANVFHPFRDVEVLDVQLRGEYLYAACGEGGLKLYDVAFIDNKGFSQRVSTAPVSPLGQRFYVPTRYATSVAAPVTTAPDPTRTHIPENHETPVHAIYAYIYVTDRYEGLILVGAGTTLDGNPLNNFLKREVTFNPDGILNGAESVTIVGTYAYVCCDAGLVVVSIEDPKCPKVTSVVGSDSIQGAKAVAAQFRYAFVCDREGIKVLDISDLSQPKPVAKLDLAHARNIYLSRTYAYVAAGPQGVAIVDITNPEVPNVSQIYDADGCMNDVHDVQLGITYNSAFAYVADGVNGLRVLQLTSPDTPGNNGFLAKPFPHLISTFKPPTGRVLAISRGVDRDRAVDESGNQISVFGRVGARPLDLAEQQRLYMHEGRIYRTSNDPSDSIYEYLGPPRDPEKLKRSRIPECVRDRSVNITRQPVEEVDVK